MIPFYLWFSSIFVQNLDFNQESLKWNFKFAIQAYILTRVRLSYDHRIWGDRGREELAYLKGSFTISL